MSIQTVLGLLWCMDFLWMMGIMMMTDALVFIFVPERWPTAGSHTCRCWPLKTTSSCSTCKYPQATNPPPPFQAHNLISQEATAVCLAICLFIIESQTLNFARPCNLLSSYLMWFAGIWKITTCHRCPGGYSGTSTSLICESSLSVSALDRRLAALSLHYLPVVSTVWTSTCTHANTHTHTTCRIFPRLSS